MHLTDVDRIASTHRGHGHSIAKACDTRATLLYDHATQDWRDVIPRVGWRTLVIGGRASFVSWQSQTWIHEQIAGSRLELFGEDEGGQHFMFMENPTKFNAVVGDFLG